MTILTLAAIAENEWNAVAYDLPTDPDRDLLEATYSAAQHCAAKEFHLMNAALVGPGRVGDERGGEGSTRSVGWRPDGAWFWPAIVIGVRFRRGSTIQTMTQRRPWQSAAAFVKDCAL